MGKHGDVCGTLVLNVVFSCNVSLQHMQSADF